MRAESKIIAGFSGVDMKIKGICIVIAAVAFAASAHAQNFPTRGVTIVSPYQAGGTNDLIARHLAQKLSERWGKPVVVENRPGANGSIGVNAVVRAEPDGHTILAASSSAVTLAPLFYKDLKYDVERDLAPITRTGSVTNVLVANPNVQAKTVAELVTLSKSSDLKYASQAVGSNGHLIAELFRLQSGATYRHIPYRGSAPALQDLVGGRVDVMFDNLPSALFLIQGGNLRPLAVTTAQRTNLLPDVPTIAEAGFPGFDVPAWFAVFVAKSTPAAIRKELESAIIDILKSPETQQKLSAAGVEVVAQGSEELARRIEAENKMWRDVVTDAHIQME